MNTALTQKYNVPGPRYTSYPTVPFWNTETFDNQQWEANLCRAFKATNADEGISVYIHLPFCESLCTYCGCTKRITVNHGIEMPYIESVIKEWELYLKLFKETPKIKELHLGGGTPTFFSADNLARLMDVFHQTAIIASDSVLSIEAHPQSTTTEKLEVLFERGFKRLSLGIQDFDKTVQRAIHRIQSFEEVENITELAREIGFTSINFDIIYGLPHQNLDSITDTIQKTALLMPDRIAFYSYAHVPWVAKGQRGYSESDLPTGEAKLQLYLKGREMLMETGYHDIGMDHFALPNDELFLAANQGTLHRNFMGYTPFGTTLTVGLGMSAISDSWTAYAQNVKSVETYQQMVDAGQLPLLRGHILSSEDQTTRKRILDIMCRHQTQLPEWGDEDEQLEPMLKQLGILEADGLIELTASGIAVTGIGQAFLRNICMVFDGYLNDKQTPKNMFSSTV